MDIHFLSFFAIYSQELRLDWDYWVGKSFDKCLHHNVLCWS